jgi:hypothetical protein
MACAGQSVSPEQLSQLAAMITAASQQSSAHSDWTDVLATVGTFVADAGWPLVALAALVLYRGPISRLRKFSYKDVALEIDREIERAGLQATEGTVADRLGVPTNDEIARSGQVERLAEAGDPTEVQLTAVRLAAEYERVRASMAAGDPRTRRMEIVVAKMRTIGRAVIPLRHELMASKTPGQRLVAIASLQVAPDYELLSWLVDRLAKETPFVSYHAAVALLVAATDPRALANQSELAAAKSQLAEVEGALPEDNDRAEALKAFKARA